MEEIKRYIDSKFEELRGLIEEQGKKVLTSKEAARLLGISVDRLYRLTEQRLIPFSRPTGKQMYFNRTELEDWAMQAKHVTRTTIEQRADVILRNLSKKNNV